MKFLKKFKSNLLLFITIIAYESYFSSENNCILKNDKINEMQRIKCKSVSSGYNICVNEKGIYSYNSLLTKLLYSYDYSSIIDPIGDSNLLGLVAIEEFKVDDIKNNIILCHLKHNYLVVLSYKGEFLFFDKLDKQFESDNYYKFILFNFDIPAKEYNYIILYPKGFQVNLYQCTINIQKKSNEFISYLEYNGNSNAGASCELLLDNFQRNILICFMIIYSEGSKFSIISILPDENFKILSTNTLTLNESFINNLKLIRTSSYDKTRVLVCLIGERESKFSIYNIIDNSLSQFILTVEDCHFTYNYIFLYYFDESEEFVFSCLDTSDKYLKFIPIEKDFTIKENNKLEYEFEGCISFETFSILFIKPLSIYNSIVVNRCDIYNPINNYLLINNESNCNNTIQNIEQLNDTYSDESDNNEGYTEIIDASQNKITSQITQKLTSQNEITKSTFLNENTEYNQINEYSQGIISSDKESQIHIKPSEIIESGKILETNNIIKSSKIDEDSNKNIDSSKFEPTDYTMKSTEIEEPNQIIEFSEIMKSDKSKKETNGITESYKTNDEHNKIIESDKSIGQSSRIIGTTQFEESQSIKSFEIIKSNQAEEYQSIKSSEIIDSSQFEEYQPIKSTEIETIDSSQADILKNFSDFSEIPEISQTNEISEFPANTQVEFSTENTESSNIIFSDEFTNDKDSIKKNEFTQVIASNEIIGSEKLAESTLMIDKAKENTKETNIINEITGNTNTERIDMTQNCEEKCSKCNENSNSKNLCIECNNEKQYFQIINSISMDNELLNEEYKECIKEETKPKNYYFNKTENAFKPCYYTCDTCSANGDSNNHNCITCAQNYILNININNNCIIACKYYFYFTNYKEYKCTIDNQCPEEASILIPELSKCTNSCKNEENYIYQYNGQCLDKCPDDTKPNEDNICEIKNVEKCTYKLLDLFLDNEIEKRNIENLAKNYAKEFSYTNNHIINYMSDEYSIILYKASECITRLKINIPKIDFKDCYQKVKNYYSLQKDLVISIIDRYIYDEKSGVKNPDTTYAFFHPETGVNLNANEICKDDKIIIEENILLIIKSNQTLLFFSNQNVDIFNISNEFYTDICFHFESPKNKDVVIKDRIQSYYPNVTLCDSGCKNTGINLTSLSAICECSFKDLLDNNFLNDNKIMDNIIINELVDQVSLALKILNLEVMKCYKTIFNPKYMSKCTGFYIVLIILLFELICVITYFLFGKKKFIGFIFKVSEIYKDLNLFKIKKRIDLDLTQNNINFPPKKKGINLKESNAFNIKNINFQDQQIQRFEKRNQSSKLISLNKLVKRKSQRKRKTMKNVSICINMTKFNINNIASNNNSNSILLMNNNYINKNNDNGNFQNMYRLSRKKIKSKSAKFSESNKVRKAVKEKFEGNSNEIGFNIEDYLLTPLDDIDFEDAILEKKSNFIIYFFERIKKQHIFINTFFIDDNIQPRSIKILLFLTEIDLYLLVNAMLFNEDYISEIFHNEKQDKFFSFTPRSINRYIYTTFSGTIIKSLIKLCFIKEKKYIKLLKRSENSRQLSTEIYLFHQKLSKGYNYFIIIVICITLFSWYYISCFNNVYQYTKNEWIISSIIFITTTLIFNALSALLETIFRYLSVELENEQIYKFSLYLRMFE